MSNKDNSKLVQVTINDEVYYKISNVDKMRPFFMSIVSDANHWLFVGSNGGISAGRKNSQYAIFPYYTDDKIIESAEYTGSKSLFRVEKNGETFVWEPFSIRDDKVYHTSRDLYKSIYGNAVIFEETNHDLNLTFQYKWSSSNRFGFVKSTKLINGSNESIQIELLDGLQNILPYGVNSGLQEIRSNLVDAYKRNELFEKSDIGIYALSAFIVDKAEPSESLKANIAWSTGLHSPTHLLSSLQLDNFRNNQSLTEESDIKAERGAYFISTVVNLTPKESKSWMIVTNVNQSISDITELSSLISNESNVADLVNEDIHAGTERLIKLNASADALQLSNDHLKDARHFANSLFNIMRGGIFDDNYSIERDDFLKYLRKANKTIAEKYEPKIKDLPGAFTLQDIQKFASIADDASLKRLCFEYLPLKFSRRHGDPSRPWNQFSINTFDENDGSKILDYEGNWRDIFQNWEALAHSFPAFIEGMIFRFLNASTFDGYNPYRITKDGIDWERIEADDPWSYIGYWGDHQIIYLLKFLEFAQDHYPNKLAQYFNADLFVYANVPYKIKSYEETLVNPKDTIDFDHDLDKKISAKCEQIGSDGVLVTDVNDNLIKVNFIEKILATVLAKISNFIPEGGIWMNTQRPEWNDANNALVGNGVSMVTLYYMIRFLKFFKSILQDHQKQDVKVSNELLECFNHIQNTLKKHENLLTTSISDKDRKVILDGLGKAASEYRQRVYDKSFNGEKSSLSMDELMQFSDTCLSFLSHTLKANKRDDGLYHAYNLMTYHEDEDEISISYLSEMLEGQVAVLSSGALNSKESLNVLDSLKASDLFRKDQYSYLLYPEKELPGFANRNNIPKGEIDKSELLTSLIADGNSKIVEKDVNGNYHFNGNFHNAKDLEAAINQLSSKYEGLVKSDKKQVLQSFEKVFNHKAFTGRSGTFYGYEGLGSIYWHMVSKLLLAVSECCQKAIDENESDEIVGRLLEHYYEVNAGIGVHKSPKLYGAFPTDPYSHTPKWKGAQQPGMTGQVKEDIISRFNELGIHTEGGQLTFNPQMLQKNEFLDEEQTFNYVDINHKNKQLTIEKGMLCFTYCQTPIIYKKDKEFTAEVIFSDGTVKQLASNVLDKNISDHIFKRDGKVSHIFVKVDESILK